MIDLIEIFAFDVVDWTVSFFSFLLCLYITRVLYNLYHHTHTLDYLLFSGIFVCYGLLAFPLQLFIFTNLLISWQLWALVTNFSALFLFFHGTRIYLKQFPKILGSIAIGFFLLLQILILLWKPMASESGILLFWESGPHRIYPANIPVSFGAGFEFNGILIYTSSHTLLALIYYLFVSIVLLYGYLSTTPSVNTPKIKLARKILITTSFFLFIQFAVYTIWIFKGPYSPPPVLILIILILISYIALRIPEAMFITQVQLARAAFLYKALISPDEMDNQPIDQSMEKIKSYFENLPPEVLQE